MSKIYIQEPAEIPGAMILEGMKEVEEQVTTQDEFDNWLEELIDKPEPGAQSKDLFFSVFNTIPKARVAEFTGVENIKDLEYYKSQQKK